MENLEKWLESVITYAIYCKEPAIQRFKNDVNVFYNYAKNSNENYILAKRRAFSVVGEIMKEIKEESPWEIIKTLYESNAKTVLDMCLIGDMMLEYSEYGTEFVEKIMDYESLRLISELMIKYDGKKELEFLKEMGYN